MGSPDVRPFEEKVIAKSQEPEEAGEEVVIARRGEPVARLVACTPKGRRRFGAMKGKIVVDDSVLEPLPEEELTLWEGRT